MKIKLRDYFAIQAMKIAIKEFDGHDLGEIPFVDKNGWPMSDEDGSIGTWFPHTQFFAESCYAIADEMMEARKK